MKDEQLMKEINQERKRKPPLAFWGLLVALQTVMMGLFIINIDGYLTAHSEPYLTLPENIIGLFAVVVGCIKIIGVLTNNKAMKRWGIWLLAAFWGGLFFISATYSFGSGYPHESYIYSFGLMAASWRISLKGDFY